eukprot:TRINITY_DN21862_c0_g1_i2.p1 TRINITY_DN21862_c0_g1~~TRINITY_DN21862_c0_g1_i2.p1  ORF type:complete len:122 (+),score=5.65 TRINITY_DN21862_c0_g1_i2:251-616(+)
MHHTLVNRYRIGLCQEIRREVLMHDFETVDEIYNKAKRVELKLFSPNMRGFSTQTGESVTHRVPDFQNNRAPSLGYYPPPRQQLLLPIPIPMFSLCIYLGTKAKSRRCCLSYSLSKCRGAF